MTPEPLIANRQQTSPGKPRNWGAVIFNVLAVVLALIWLIPFIFSVLMSFRPQSSPVTSGNIFVACEDSTDTQGLPSCSMTLDNYTSALVVAPWGAHYLTSIIVVIGTLAVQLITVTMAGYAFARLRFFGKNLLFGLILLQMMIPIGVLLAQNFATIRELGLFDTRWALMLPYWGSAFGTLLMRQAFKGVPLELEEAARIDGANWLQIMRTVYVPLSIPTYVAFGIVSVSARWNEFLWAFTVTRTEAVRPLTVGLNKLFQTSDVGALYGQLMAGTLFVILPLIIVFMLFQRRFIESFATSGIK